MLKERGGQVTIFVLLGVVLIIVFSIALLARSVLFQDQLQGKAEQMVSDFLQQNSITYYVESTLEQVSIDVIRTTTEQGGYYDLQGEHEEDFLIYEYNGSTYQVAYGLIENNESYCPQVHSQSPNYPRPNTYLRDLNYFCPDQSNGFFGLQTLPNLCFKYGENGGDATERIRYWCETYNYGYQNNQTIQGRIEESIKNELINSVDFGIYERRGHNVTLLQDNISIRAIYGLDNINIIATFPFEVDVGGTKPIFSQRDFYFRTPIRLVRMHNYLVNLLAQDARNYSFNIEQDFWKVPFYDSRFNVTLERNPCAVCVHDGLYDDIIRIEDPESLIENKALILQSAIRNRRPALDWIHQTGGGNEYDVQAVENQSIMLRPKGYDPDDTLISYSYAGWKETEDSTFLWEEFLVGNCPDYEDCVVTEDVANHNWTESIAYDTTLQYANISVYRSDAGPHTVTITVMDEQGKEDYQHVRILVFDLPIAVPNGTSGFAGLKENQASIEDPYFLNASASQASVIGQAVNGEEINAYRWMVDAIIPPRTRIFDKNLTEPEYWMPNEIWRTHFYNNITQLPFNYSVQHELNLTVRAGYLQSVPETLLVDVHQCIPYRNSTGSDPGQDDYEILSHSFPYNTSPSTLYDHTCCQGNIVDEVAQVLGYYGDAGMPDAVCFDTVEYGSFIIFSDFQHLSSNGNTPVPLPTPNVIITIPNGIDTENVYSTYSNDIFRRNYSRLCGGSRGNVCDGEVVETWERILPCGDDFNGDERVERCEGPVVNHPLINEPALCRTYSPGDSFETLMNIPALDGSEANGTCDRTPRCSNDPDIDPLSYGTGETGIAQGECAGGGCLSPSGYRSCETENYFQCDTVGPTYHWVNHIYGCEEGSNGPSCEEASTQNTWSNCAQPNQLESWYCDETPRDPGVRGRCGELECCDESNMVAGPCTDPCLNVHPDCFNEFAGDQGRICGIPPNCALLVGNSCESGSGTCDVNGQCIPTP